MSEAKPLAQPLDTVSLADEDAVKKLLIQSVYSLWDVVNNLTRLKPTKRDRYRVTIFGSARAEPGTFVYEEVKRLAEELTKLDCDIITGGGPGLMAAANQGASQAKSKDGSIGIRVQLDFEQTTNPYVGHEFVHRTFFSRLHHFVLASDAYIVVPGGIGTALEALMVWQLLQVRKLYDTPLIMAGKMWSELVAWADKFMNNPSAQLVSPNDTKIPYCTTSVEEIVEIIRKHRAARNTVPKP